MMKIEIQTPKKMTQNGSSILRVIQNNNTPEADLLVRESIQNSLDAAIGNHSDVQVEFTIKEFETKKLANELELVGEKLTKNYEKTEKYLCVRDFQTAGLTGTLSHDDILSEDSYGNLLKLIYDIGKPQEKEGAGGSWGYGKTIFYRIGMGLVFYYSRIQLSNGQYEERLAAVMVENEEKDSFIPSYNGRVNTGVAWWGEKIGENKTIPVTNRKYIHNFLEIFDIKPYRGIATGTAIIMPFINEKNILRNNAHGSDQGEARIKYYDDLADYLSYSVQRWYFPRLNNPHYNFGNKKILKVAVNGKQISFEDQEPYFKLLLDLYNYAITERSQSLMYLENNEKIIIEPINLRNSNQIELDVQEAGKIVFGMFTFDDLGMGTPGQVNNPHFLSNLNQEENEMNEPIITYTRQPGMIINYEDRSIWTKNIPQTSRDSYLLGIFVLNSNNRLVIEDKNFSLEEYIRQGERADHTSWHDHSNYGINPSIVQRIQNNIVNKIRREYEEQVERLETDNDGRLSKIFGETILPPSDFGKKASKKKKVARTSDVVIRSSNLRSSLILDSIDYKGDKIEIPFTISILGSGVSEIEFTVEIDTESSSLSITRYEDETDRESPINIVRLEMYGKKEVYSHSGEESDFQTFITGKGTLYSLIIKGSFNKDDFFDGSISLGTRSLDVRPSVRIRAKENKDVDN